VLTTLNRPVLESARAARAQNSVSDGSTGSGDAGEPVDAGGVDSAEGPVVPADSDPGADSDASPDCDAPADTPDEAPVSGPQAAATTTSARSRQVDVERSVRGIGAW